jgi:hypothetical protein
MALCGVFLLDSGLVLFHVCFRHRVYPDSRDSMEGEEGRLRG